MGQRGTQVSEKTLRINEIFYSLQGESRSVGLPSYAFEQMSRRRMTEQVRVNGKRLANPKLINFRQPSIGMRFDPDMRQQFL